MAIRCSYHPRGESTVTSERIPAGTGGFTLVEIMVAMVILAIGLLGLEALGIGAARSNALAARQSAYATLTSDSLESAIHQLRQQVFPSQFCQTDLPYGDRLSRQVDVSNPLLPTVTVRVIPNPESVIDMDEFQISSSLYLPVAIAGAPAGSPCD